MTPCFFVFDDSPPFAGFAYGSRWNGFDNVAVTPAVLRDIVAWFEAGYPDDGNDDLLAIEPDEAGLISLAFGYATQIVEAPACELCDGAIIGYGHNAYPIARGRCCDACNPQVVARRIELCREAPETFEADGERDAAKGFDACERHEFSSEENFAAYMRGYGAKP
jgi:hypothetical protein